MFGTLRKDFIATAAVCFTLVAGAAHAVPVYNFGGSNLGDIGASGNFLEGGISLTIAATDPSAIAPTIDIANAGIGVNGSSGSARIEDGEGLDLTFGTSVTLANFVFRDARDGFDSFDLFANGLFATSFIVNSINPATGENITILLPGGVTGTTFSLVRTDGDSGQDIVTGVKLNSLELAAVPIPAALPMLLAGLGALGYTARRRRNRAN